MKKLIAKSVKIILLVAFLVVGCFTIYHRYHQIEQSEDFTEVEPKNKTVSLIMVGDGLIHGAVYQDAKVENGYDFKPMLKEMKPIISQYDLAFYNQESILGGEELGLSTYPNFNSPYEVGDAFLDAGFNLVSLANNHTLDRGEKAIIHSMNYWQTKDVYYSGTNLSEEEQNHILIKEKNGIKYAVLSYTCWTNGLTVPSGKYYLLNRYDPELVKSHVESIRDRVDVVMVSMHWGEEYSYTPDSDQREIADYLASLGVDIIIGHHPHVVQPIEKIGNTLVVYSLGNFLSGQTGIEKLTGLMVSLNIKKNMDTKQITLEDVKAELTYTYSDNIKGYRGNFKVYPYTKLTESILPNYEIYYNRYIGIAVGENTWIERSDYNGDSK